MLDENLRHLRHVIAHQGSTQAVDMALAPIAADRDPASIGPLLLMLNDDADDDWMWSLIHAVEQFDDAIYVEGFLRALSDLVVASNRWSSILMMRALNNDATQAELVRQLRSAPNEIRKAAASLCHAINEREVRFLAKTAPILIAAKQ